MLLLRRPRQGGAAGPPHLGPPALPSGAPPSPPGGGSPLSLLRRCREAPPEGGCPRSSDGGGCSPGAGPAQARSLAATWPGAVLYGEATTQVDGGGSTGQPVLVTGALAVERGGSDRADDRSGPKLPCLKAPLRRRPPPRWVDGPAGPRGAALHRESLFPCYRPSRQKGEAPIFLFPIILGLTHFYCWQRRGPPWAATSLMSSLPGRPQLAGHRQTDLRCALAHAPAPLPANRL